MRPPPVARLRPALALVLVQATACMPGVRPLPNVGPPVAAAPAARPARNSVAVVATTLGVGGEVGRLVAPWLGVRVGAAGLSAAPSFRAQGVTYRADVRARGAYGFVDLYPMPRSGFRLTGGLLRNGTRLAGSAPPEALGDGPVTINGREYAAEEVGTLGASVAFPRTAPFLSFGFGKPPKAGRGVGVRVESGTTFGKLRLGLTSSRAAANPQLAADLAAWERQGQGLLRKLPGLPFMSAALTYRY